MLTVYDILHQHVDLKFSDYLVILFFIKSFKQSSNKFNVLNHVNFTTGILLDLLASNFTLNKLYYELLFLPSTLIMKLLTYNRPI